jgi:hypothetical protein
LYLSPSNPFNHSHSNPSRNLMKKMVAVTIAKTVVMASIRVLNIAVPVVTIRKKNKIVPESE